MLDIIGTSSNELLDGTLGDDFLHGLGGNDVVRGLAGSDLIHGNQGADILNGNTENDIIYAGQGDDTAYGGKDNDFVCGDLGNDWLYGNLGDDTGLGMVGTDRLWGNEGADILNGNQGDDTVDGGEDNDLLYGGKGHDVLIGGLGDDILCGDLGVDTLTGGEGADRFVIRKGIGGATLAEADVITDFVQDEDAIALEDGLTFDDLEIYQGSGENAGDTIIREKATGQYLAILQQFDGELVVDDDNPSQIVTSESSRRSSDSDWMKNLPIFTSTETPESTEPEQEFVSPLQLSQDAWFIGEETEVTFSAAVSKPNSEIQVEVFETDASGNIESSAIQLFDDGDLEKGDDIAGDGIYNNKLSVNPNSEGEKFYTAVLTDSEEKTTETDPIQVDMINHLSDEGLAETLEFNTSVDQKLADAFDAGQTKEQAVAQVQAFLEANPDEVQSVNASDDGLSWVTKDGVTVVLDTSLFDDELSKGSYSLSGNSNSSSSQTNETAAGDSVNSSVALVLSPYAEKFEPLDEADEIADSLQNVGFSVMEEYDSDVTVEDFKHLDQYGVVVISSHGQNLGSEFFLSAGQVLSAADKKDYEADLKTGRIAIGSDNEALITPEFIAKYTTQMPNSLVYVSSCHSTANNSLVDAFLDRGAGAFVGYSDKVKSDFANSHGQEMFDALVKGQVTGEIPGINSDAETDETPAKFELKGSDSLSLFSGLNNGNFETGNFSGWVTQGDTRLITALGPLAPPEGDLMAIISTGLGSVEDSQSSISQTLFVSPYTKKLSLTYDVISEEPMEFVDSEFDDKFEVVLKTQDGEETVLAEESVNQSAWEAIDGIDFYEGDDTTFHTGFQTVDYDLTPFQGEIVTLQLRTFDKGDSLFDTAAVVDDVQVEVDAPENTQENLPPTSLKFSFPQTTYQLGEPITIANGQVYDAQDFIDLDRVDFWLQKDAGEWIKLDESVTTFDLTGTMVGWANFSYELTDIEAGNYQLKAIAYDQSGAASEPTIQSFTVGSVAEPQVSNSLENAIDLGLLDDADSVNDSVDGSNPDYYRFELDDSSYFNLVLDQLSADANVQLIQDSNNNGLVDDAEVLASSMNSGTTDEGISRILETGTYYIQVSPSESNDNSNYQLSLSANLTAELPIDPLTGAEYMPGELLVKFNSNVAPSQWSSIAGEYGFNTVEPLGDPDQSSDSFLNQWAFLEADSEVDVQSALIQLSENSNVEVSQFNYLISMNGSWGSKPVDIGELSDIGKLSDIGDKIKQIKAPDVWEEQPGSKKITVAVLDTGVDYEHPDLAGSSAVTGNIWKNDPIFKGDVMPGEGLNSTGKDIGEDDEDPMDTDGHGTHVAGIIGALPNGTGVAGVSPNVGIMPVKITDNEGKSSSAIAVQAIDWAIQNGADVINASWYVSNPNDSTLYDAIKEAKNKDVLFVLSSNENPQPKVDDLNVNGGDPIEDSIYDLENVISVGRESTSGVDLQAPGEYIYSTTKNKGYAEMTGNSMATAHVSGAAALLLAECPALTASDIEGILKDTASNGFLNVEAALNSVQKKVPTKDVNVPMNEAEKPETFGGSVSSNASDYYRLNYFIVSGVSWNTVMLKPDGNITAELIDEWGNVLASTDPYYQPKHFEKWAFKQGDNGWTKIFTDYQKSEYMYLRVSTKEEQNTNYEVTMYLDRGASSQIL